MRLLLLFACILAFSTASAQQNAETTVPYRALHGNLLLDKLSSPIPVQESATGRVRSGKASASTLDTLSEMVNLGYPEVDSCNIESTLFDFIWLEDFGGYLNGTSGFISFVGGGDTFVFVMAEHGTAYQFPETVDSQYVRLFSVFAVFSTNCKVVDTPDMFKMNVTEINGSSPSSPPRATPLYTQEFSAENFYNYVEFASWPQPNSSLMEYILDPDDNEIYIPSDTTFPLTGRKVISIETAREDIDDSLAIIVKTKAPTCDPTYANQWWVRLRNTTWGNEGWAPFNQLFGFSDTPDDWFSAMLIIPVVEFVSTTPVGNDKAFVKGGGLTLRSNVPNPAASATTLRYELDHPMTVSIRVVDAAGREILATPKVMHAAGSHTYDLDVTGLASGFYTYFIESDNGRLASRFSVSR